MTEGEGVSIFGQIWVTSLWMPPYVSINKTIKLVISQLKPHPTFPKQYKSLKRTSRKNGIIRNWIQGGSAGGQWHTYVPPAERLPIPKYDCFWKNKTGLHPVSRPVEWWVCLKFSKMTLRNFWMTPKILLEGGLTYATCSGFQK